MVLGGTGGTTWMERRLGTGIKVGDMGILPVFATAEVVAPAAIVSAAVFCAMACGVVDAGEKAALTAVDDVVLTMGAGAARVGASIGACSIKDAANKLGTGGCASAEAAGGVVDVVARV